VRHAPIRRRDFLKGLGAGFAAGPLGACVPQEQIDKVISGEIDTIVICMMENRSFDHVFGSYSLLEGRSDVDGLVAGMFNPDLDGNPVAINESTQSCVVPDPPHGWSTSRQAFASGKNDGFVRSFLESRGASNDPRIPMAYQTRAHQPISYALADGNALYQRWFSAVLTSTWPNRLYFHAAQSMGSEGNDLPGGSFYTCRTLWDQLDEAGIEWGYYFTDLPTLGLFGRQEWLDRMGSMDDFYSDADRGRLPRVVCVDPGAGFNDDHPPHHTMLGQLFIASVYDALAKSPHWDKSLFVLTYDEAGGFYDHVPPGLADDDLADKGFGQLGFRVPSLVCGPYVRPGAVIDTVVDHTAAMTFIQDWMGIDERLNARNAASAGLLDAIDGVALAANKPRSPLKLPAIGLSEAEIEAQCRTLGQRTGQPELQSLIRGSRPSMDRTADLPDIARRFFRRAGDRGLWVPS
jgi:phospholipase C